MGTAQDTYRDKNLTDHNAIQACAKQILENMHNGIKEKPKGYTASRITRAYKLLLFEGLISRLHVTVLSERGQKHINKHGYDIYPLTQPKIRDNI